MDADNVGGNRPLRFRAFGDNRPDTEMPPVQSVRRVTPDYFRTVGIPLIAGRAFRDSDTEESPMVILVNRSLARRTWKNEDALGKRITFDGEHYLEIVGVVGDVREFGPR
jgi:putative ABC transport system permease protein